MFTRIINMLRSFRHKEDGSLSIEAVLMFPMLVWALAGSYVFFDGYRSKAVNLKAAYTISDILSRETGYVTPSYMSNLYTLQERLTYSDASTSLRITIVGFDANSNQYDVRWSQASGNVQPLTTALLQNMTAQLPLIPNGEVVILVQNWVHYQPVFRNMFSPINFENFVITRPRFAPQLCWNTSDTGGMATSTC